MRVQTAPARAAAGQADINAKKAARRFSRRYGRGGISAAGLLDLVRDYLNDRFGLSYGALTSSEVVEILSARGIGADTVEKLKACLQHCENAVYSGKGDAVVRIEEDPVQLIKKIEKESR